MRYIKGGAIQAAAGLIIVNALVVLIGYAVGLDSLTSWKLGVPMSVPTSINFLVVGICFLMNSKTQ